MFRNDIPELLAGSGNSEQGWLFSRLLLGAPDTVGVPPETALGLAAHHLFRAATAGNHAAQGELGYLYLVGWGVPQSDAHAAYWFERSARGGHDPAQLAIGAMYALGRGVQRNETTAVSWFGKAEAGLRLVGDAYACGFGVEQDLERAKALYERAAGDVEAQERLAGMHAAACGTPLDGGKALALYEEAAQAGHPRAQVALAELLVRTSKDGAPTPVPAYMWAELAFVRLPDGHYGTVRTPRGRRPRR